MLESVPEARFLFALHRVFTLNGIYRLSAAGQTWAKRPIPQVRTGVTWAFPRRPWATAHGAHSGTSTPSSRRVRMAPPSQTPLSWGCAVAHRHWQAPQFPANAARTASTAARAAGSSFSMASAVAAETWSRHSPSAAVAACQAAASCRAGLPG